MGRSGPGRRHPAGQPGRRSPRASDIQDQVSQVRHRSGHHHPAYRRHDQAWPRTVQGKELRRCLQCWGTGLSGFVNRSQCFSVRIVRLWRFRKAAGLLINFCSYYYTLIGIFQIIKFISRLDGVHKVNAQIGFEMQSNSYVYGALSQYCIIISSFVYVFSLVDSAEIKLLNITW